MSSDAARALKKLFSGGKATGESSITKGFYCFGCGKSIIQTDRKSVRTHGGFKPCVRNQFKKKGE